MAELRAYTKEDWAKNALEKRPHTEISTDQRTLLLFDQVEVEFEPRDW